MHVDTQLVCSCQSLDLWDGKCIQAQICCRCLASCQSALYHFVVAWPAHRDFDTAHCILVPHAQ